MKCLICKKTETVKFLDNYKLEIKEDIKFFNDLKIYNCEDCDFSFVSPAICSNDTAFVVNSSSSKPPSTYLWLVTSPNPNGVVISDATAFEPTFTFPFNQSLSKYGCL